MRKKCRMMAWDSINSRVESEEGGRWRGEDSDERHCSYNWMKWVCKGWGNLCVVREV